MGDPKQDSTRCRLTPRRVGALSALAAATVVLSLLVVPAPVHAAIDPSDTSTVAEIQREAARLRLIVGSKMVRSFLDATNELPHVQTRTILHDSSRTHYYSEAEAALLPDSARARLVVRRLDETFYYNTRYGSPLAYARPLELLAAAGLRDVSGRRIADFGYGTVGHLRLLASLGAEVVGIEVDPLLNLLYGAEGDRGVIRSASGRTGKITLAHGNFPGDSAIARAVGDGFDVFLSKNTLKNGYIHPEQPVNPRQLVHLGVDDTTYVRNIRRVLKPGGLAMIYNLCPAPNGTGKPYRPWADGRCPFARALWEAEGFDVLEFDRDDSVTARAMGRALRWDQGPGAMDLAHDLFASYTLVRKRAPARTASE